MLSLFSRVKGTGTRNYAGTRMFMTFTDSQLDEIAKRLHNWYVEGGSLTARDGRDARNWRDTNRRDA
jgi:hypothetical protein